jgi:peptidoglycan L-alanyl-D-glutamate endopeptidase CwlK
MVLMALGTIRAETASFQPIDEFESPYNTPPGGPPFALYDNRADLGNQGPTDGEDFKGRGFVQLTGRANYTHFSSVLGLGTQLVDNPDLANDPDIAARLLAAFLKDKEDRIRSALAANDLATARRLVNGGTHGLTDFSDAFRRGQGLIPDNVQVQAA